MDAGSSTSITQLHKLLFSLLLKPHESEYYNLDSHLQWYGTTVCAYTSLSPAPISIQLSAAESLLDLCPPSHPSSHDATSVLMQWLRGLSKLPAGPDLQCEFQARLHSYQIASPTSPN